MDQCVAWLRTRALHNHEGGEMKNIGELHKNENTAKEEGEGETDKTRDRLEGKDLSKSLVEGTR